MERTARAALSAGAADGIVGRKRRPTGLERMTSARQLKRNGEFARIVVPDTNVVPALTSPLQAPGSWISMPVQQSMVIDLPEDRIMAEYPPLKYWHVRCFEF